jgi:hypothetical protein
MDNQEIAKRVTNMIFKPKEEESDLFAVQLFVEKVVLPNNVNTYTKNELESRIINYLQE